MDDIQQVLTTEVGLILGIDTTEIAADAPLSDLGMDSLSFVELLVAIEKNFKINLMESGLTREDFNSIEALAESITKIKKIS